MGSGDSKKRKPARHLPKVGSPREVAWAQREKRREISHDVGLGTGAGGRGLVWILVAIGVVLIVAALTYLVLR
jgi:hypothetical protein